MSYIPVSEIFSSLQGEGTRCGIPSVFIRFWGCNLSCDFCDSRFSWDKAQGKPYQKTLTEVCREIQKYSVKNLIFTGGEPMLRQQDIKRICDEIQPEFVEIETNGTIASTIDSYVHQYNISPKFDFKKPVLFEDNIKTSWKFIVRNKEDIQKIDTFCQKKNISKEHILFQPEGQTRSEIMQHIDITIEAATKRGVRVSPRFHILLWDDKRAV